MRLRRGEVKYIIAAIKAAAAIIAALPSIATLTGLIETPDEQAVVVTFICGFVGVVCILSVAILSPVIGRARPLRIASVVVALTVAGAISSVSYYISRLSPTPTAADVCSRGVNLISF